jgi:drug/metabolite transporter (DMT)-like permease
MSLQTRSSNKALPGILLMLFSSLCLCCGQLFWKLLPLYGVSVLVLGFIVYFVGAVAMLVAYHFGELSVLQPINSTSYVFMLFIAIFLIREEIHLVRIAGVFVIVVGVLLIVTGKEK